jgi:nitroreductase/NAD-dependent dihydropyrimidine dehydrogenase PreA subunit
MINKDIQVEIDVERCIGCGICIKVCPQRTLSLVHGKAAPTGKASFSCGHCEAACPQKAIRVQLLHNEMGTYQTFIAQKKWLPFGKYDIVGLQQLMASRRSCRNYTDQTVDRSLLQDLIKIGATAPSGTNSQQWTFTIVPSRKAVTTFALHIGAYFKRLNSLAAKPLIRTILKLIGKNELATYYRDHYESVQTAIVAWEQEGRDRLFHGASAAIVVGSKPGASCPMEDALLATQNILLAAHSMGLGSCLIGFAVAAMKKDRTIQRAIGIPPEDAIYTVIALGYPDETYQRVIRRKKVELRYFES